MLIGHDVKYITDVDSAYRTPANICAKTIHNLVTLIFYLHLYNRLSIYNNLTSLII